MQENQIQSLIAKYLAGEATAQEEHDLRHWVDTNKENEQVFEDAFATWEAVNGPVSDFTPNIDAAWDKVANKIGVKSIRTVPMYRKWLQAAAMITLLVGVGYFFYAWLLKTPQQVQVQILATTSAPKDFWLPDSSHVWLNKNSRLSFDQTWAGNQRNVSLEGEAFFEVVRDTKRPFKVKTGSATTEVLGTSFNVKAYDVDDDIEVKVATGKVALKAAQKQVLLVPGSKGVFEKESSELTQAPNKDMGFMAWGEKRLVFDNSRLEVVKQTLESFFDVTVEFEKTQIEDCHFTGIYDNPDLDNILDILSATTGLKVNKESDIKYVISGTCKN